MRFQPRNRLHIRPADQLIDHQDALNAAGHRRASLPGAACADPPCARPLLGLKNPRRHRRFAVRRQRDAARVGIALHPGDVILQRRFFQQRGREADLLRQQIRRGGHDGGLMRNQRILMVFHNIILSGFMLGLKLGINYN